MSNVELSDSYLLYPLIVAATKGREGETKIRKLRTLSQGSQSLGNKDVLQALGKHILSATFLLHLFSLPNLQSHATVLLLTQNTLPGCAKHFHACLLFFFLAVLLSRQDLNPPTRD